MTIDADVGEMASGVPDALRAMGVEVRVSQLHASDYLVVSSIGLERKSVLDLHHSIENRRLWSQRRAYRSILRRLFLLVEGTYLDNGSVTEAGIRGALLEIGDRGVTVIRSSAPSRRSPQPIRASSRKSQGSDLRFRRRSTTRRP